MFTGSRVAVVLLGVPLLIVTGFLVFLATKTLVEGGEAQETVTSSSPLPVIESSTAEADTPASGPLPVKCGEAATTDVAGNPLGALEPLVRGIHGAACRRDYSGLLPYMDESFGEFPKADVVAGWKQQDSDGALMRTLAETLETPSYWRQGGHYFCHSRGAVAVFARGTHDHPGMWSDFDPTGQREPPGMCEVAR